MPNALSSPAWGEWQGWGVGSGGGGLAGPCCNRGAFTSRGCPHPVGVHLTHAFLPGPEQASEGYHGLEPHAAGVWASPARRVTGHLSGWVLKAPGVHSFVPGLWGCFGDPHEGQGQSGHQGACRSSGNSCVPTGVDILQCFYF